MAGELPISHHRPAERDDRATAAGAAEQPGPPEQPVFFYDFASPASYLAAERMLGDMPVVPEWQPFSAGAPAFRCVEEQEIHAQEIERRAAAQGLQPLRWPPEWPGDTTRALLAATYAKGIGRVVAFSLAAFRQAYAGGRDLADTETILIAAAANEMHPKAVLKGIELRSTRAALDAGNERAAAAGVRDAPAILVGGVLHEGPEAVDLAIAAMLETASA